LTDININIVFVSFMWWLVFMRLKYEAWYSKFQKKGTGMPKQRKNKAHAFDA